MHGNVSTLASRFKSSVGKGGARTNQCVAGEPDKGERREDGGFQWRSLPDRPAPVLVDPPVRKSELESARQNLQTLNRMLSAAVEAPDAVISALEHRLSKLERTLAARAE